MKFGLIITAKVFVTALTIYLTGCTHGPFSRRAEDLQPKSDTTDTVGIINVYALPDQSNYDVQDTVFVPDTACIKREKLLQKRCDSLLKVNSELFQKWHVLATKMSAIREHLRIVGSNRAKYEKFFLGWMRRDAAVD